MDDRERQLEIEGAARPRVALISIVAGLLYVGAQLADDLLINAKTPTIGLVQGFAPVLHGLKAAAVDPRTIQERFLSDHAATSIAISVVIAIALTLMRWPLRYLRDAAVARGAKPSEVTRWLANYAPPAFGLSVLAFAIALALGAHDYISHTARDSAAISSANGGAVRVFLLIVAQGLGPLAMATVFVLVSLRAMRAGLLTRLLGILGIIGGVVFFLQIVPIPLLQMIWLVGVGMMLAQVGGMRLPPAWVVGEAVPWVSTPRPATNRARGARAADKSSSATKTLAPRVPEGASPAASKKRKRRRG
jgi:hypothetical protein